MPSRAKEDSERRWIPAYCYSCNVDHGVTIGGLLSIIEASQNGELITTGGTSLCIGIAVKPDTRIGNYRVDFTPIFKG